MEIKDLRIGNLIYEIVDYPENPNEKQLFEVAAIDSYAGTLNDVLENITQLEYCEPILITEKLLIKFGFEITYSSQFRLKFDHAKNNEIGFDFSHTPDKSMEGFRYFGHYIKIEHIHQLQNLFFALTGSELQLNERK